MDKAKKKAYMAEYYKKHREENLARVRKWQKEHPERTRETVRKACRKHYEKNKEKVAASIKNVRAANPEKYREIQRLSCKKYQEKNAEALAQKRKEKYPFLKKPSAEKQREYARNMNKNNINHNIKCRLRSALRNALKKSVVSKKYSAMELLGISIPDFKKYLESKFQPGMNWENKGEWHIDHIKPCATFDLTDVAQQRECFHYSNLQPLWGTVNYQKNSMYNGKRYNYKRLKKEAICQ